MRRRHAQGHVRRSRPPAVISSISFSNRLDEDYAPETWRTRFFLLDGWLGVLYLAVFCAIAFIWRPSPFNKRLAMSDEVASGDHDDDAFELPREDDDDDVEAGGYALAERKARNGGDGKVGDDGVVFDIGDDGEDDAETEGLYDGGRHHGDRRSDETAPPGYSAPGGR